MYLGWRGGAFLVYHEGPEPGVQVAPGSWEVQRKQSLPCSLQREPALSTP